MTKSNIRLEALFSRGLGRVAAATYLGVSPSLFDKMVADGSMPKAKRIYGRKVWDKYLIDIAFDDLPIEDEPEADPNDAKLWMHFISET